MIEYGPSRTGSVRRLRQRVKVLFGCGDAGVAKAVLDDLEVCAAGEEPRRVGVAQAVRRDLERDPGSGDGRLPDVSAEPVTSDMAVGVDPAERPGGPCLRPAAWRGIPRRCPCSVGSGSDRRCTRWEYRAGSFARSRWAQSSRASPGQVAAQECAAAARRTAEAERSDHRAGVPTWRHGP